MDDATIVHHISELADREHELEQRAVGEPLSTDELAQLEDLEIQLDQCWDLLRQRRALRETGGSARANPSKKRPKIGW